MTTPTAEERAAREYGDSLDPSRVAKIGWQMAVEIAYMEGSRDTKRQMLAGISEAREEAEDWKGAFTELARYIPNTYGDERDAAVNAVMREMKRKKECRESWRTTQEGAEGK